MINYRRCPPYRLMLTTILFLLLMLKHHSCSQSQQNSESEMVKRQLLGYYKCKSNTSIYKESLEGFCKADFDGWECWPYTRPSYVRTIPCAVEYIDITSNFTGNASRWCNDIGQWEEANYDSCNGMSQKPDITLMKEQVKYIETMIKTEYETPEVRHAYRKCLVEVILQPDSMIEGSYCPRIFDGWGCWNDTIAGSTAYIQCPPLVLGFSEKRKAHKVCQSNGEWFKHPETNVTWSNYTTCVDEDDLKFRRRINSIYIGGYSVSVVALCISLLIFSCFRSLQSTRISIHKNLFISFIVNNSAWIMWYSQVVNKPEVMIKNGFGCQILHVIVHYFLVCNYLWMFCEGLFLFTILVSSFIAEESMMIWFYITGWGAPAILTVIYASVRASMFSSETIHCWIYDSPLKWILSGPVCLSMLLNLGFLIKIVQVLVTKLRSGNSVESYQTRKAVRATLILIPLLGLHYILTPFRPETKSSGEAVYETISAVVTSFQGFCVSFLFCFTNGEIHHLLKKKFDEILLRRSIEIERSIKIRSEVYKTKC